MAALPFDLGTKDGYNAWQAAGADPAYLAAFNSTLQVSPAAQYSLQNAANIYSGGDIQALMATNPDMYRNLVLNANQAKTLMGGGGGEIWNMSNQNAPGKMQPFLSGSGAPASGGAGSIVPDWWNDPSALSRLDGSKPALTYGSAEWWATPANQRGNFNVVMPQNPGLMPGDPMRNGAARAAADDGLSQGGTAAQPGAGSGQPSWLDSVTGALNSWQQTMQQNWQQQQDAQAAAQQAQQQAWQQQNQSMQDMMNSWSNSFGGLGGLGGTNTNGTNNGTAPGSSFSDITSPVYRPNGMTDGGRNPANGYQSSWGSTSPFRATF